MILSLSPVSAMGRTHTFSQNQVVNKVMSVIHTKDDVQYEKEGLSRKPVVCIGAILGGLVGAVIGYFLHKIRGYELLFPLSISTIIGILGGFILAGILALIFIPTPTTYPFVKSKNMFTSYNGRGAEIVRMDEIPEGYIAILLDLILLLMLLIGAYRGYKSGLISQLFTTLAILVVLISGRGVFDSALALVSRRWPDLDTTTLSFISFTILLLILLFFVVVIEKVLRNVLRLTFLGYFDSLLGGIVGFIQSSFFLAVLIWLLGIYGINFPESYTQHMRVYKAIYNFMPKVVGVLKGYVAQYLSMMP